MNFVTLRVRLGLRKLQVQNDAQIPCSKDRPGHDGRSHVRCDAQSYHLGKRIWTDLGIPALCLLLLLRARLFLPRCTNQRDLSESPQRVSHWSFVTFFLFLKKITRWQVPWNSSHAFASVLIKIVVKQWAARIDAPQILAIFGNFIRHLSRTCTSHLPMASWRAFCWTRTWRESL